jgi:hypothetical protein
MFPIVYGNELEYNKMPYMIDDNAIRGIIMISKEDILSFSKKISKYFIKTITYIAKLSEMIYLELDYSEAKTNAGIIVVICFITIISFHLFYCIIKRNKN